MDKVYNYETDTWDDAVPEKLKPVFGIKITNIKDYGWSLGACITRDSMEHELCLYINLIHVSITIGWFTS